MGMIYTSGLTEEAVERIAVAHQVPAPLIKAIIKTESSNDPGAVRYEPAYRYLWNCILNEPFRRPSQAELNSSFAPSDFRSPIGSAHTEWHGQRTSWGPMQIMGAVARELGFRGFFPALCGEPGVEYGVIHFNHLFKRFHTRFGMKGVIAAYNAGSPVARGDGFANQEYVDKVIQNIPVEFRHEGWLK